MIWMPLVLSMLLFMGTLYGGYAVFRSAQPPKAIATPASPFELSSEVLSNLSETDLYWLKGVTDPYGVYESLVPPEPPPAPLERLVPKTHTPKPISYVKPVKKFKAAKVKVAPRPPGMDANGIMQGTGVPRDVVDAWRAAGPARNAPNRVPERLQPNYTKDERGYRVGFLGWPSMGELDEPEDSSLPIRYDSLQDTSKYEAITTRTENKFSTHYTTTYRKVT